MKQLKFSTLLFFITIESYSQTVFYSEDFNGGIPIGWSIIDSVAVPNGEIWQWSDTIIPFAVTPMGAITTDSFSTVGTTAANGYVIYNSDGYGDNSTDENSSLVSLPINCTGRSPVHLSMSQYYRDFTNSVASVFISTDSVNWTDVMDFDSTSSNPDPVDLNISSIAANEDTVYLRFRYVGNWGWYWMLDDIKLYVPSGIGLVETDNPGKISFYPNPSTGIVNIGNYSNFSSFDINVYNTIGKLVYRTSTKNSTHQKIDLSFLQTGVYAVQLTTNNTSFIQLLILQEK